MIRFEQPEHLYFLLVIPVLVLLFSVAMVARKRRMTRLGNSELLQRLMPERSKYKLGLKFGILAFALLLLGIGWANPQRGTKTRKVNRKSIDVFIGLDISQSMMAQDFVPNRLERAKRFARTLNEKLAGERLGLIIFAGNSYLQVPLTTDYAAMDLMIRSANPNLAPTQGTAIAEAVDLAERSFPEENTNHKVLILISDGENHEPEAIQRVQTAKANGLTVFTIGVGTEEGSFIPILVNGRSDYKRDTDGTPVRSQLNEEMLRNVAKEGGGSYFNLANESEEVITALRQRVDQLEKRELEQRIFDEYNSYFQYFLFPAILLILIEFLLHYRRNDYFAGKDLFKN